MSRRHRYTEVGNNYPQRFSNFGYTTTGIPVGGMSVPIGCITPYGGMPFTLDGGHTWIDPYTGQAVEHSSRIYIDPYGRPIHVVQTQRPVSQQVQQPVSQQVQQSVSQQVQQPVSQQVQQSVPQQVQQPVSQQSGQLTDILVNQRTGERIVVQRQQNQHTSYDVVFGQTPVAQIQSAQNVRTQNLHPSIIETGIRDQFSGYELIRFKNVECRPPNGVRNYIYNDDRTAVTLVVTQPNGGQWSRTFDI